MMNQADRAKLRALVEYLQHRIKDARGKAQQHAKRGDACSAHLAQGIEVGLGIALRQLTSTFDIPIEQEEQS